MKYYRKEEYVTLRTVANFTIQVGDRLRHIPSGKDDYYAFSYNQIPDKRGQLITELIDQSSVRLHGNGKKIIAINQRWVVSELKTERDTRKRELNDKEFQKNRVLRCLKEAEDYFKDRKKLMDRTLDQIPIGKRFVFLANLTKHQRRIFDLMYEDFSTQKDKR